MTAVVRLLAVPVVILALACGGAPAGDAELVVFAAASLREVATELGLEFEKRHPVQVVFNFAGSNTLAQQLRAAPRADVFLSADFEWVEALDRDGVLARGSSRRFLSNTLVLIARRDADWKLPALDDLPSLDFLFLAMADPAAVPAGRYAKAALARRGSGGADLWSRVESRVAPALDARAALALVESDPRILGLVYRTDALTSAKVRILLELPPGAEEPIAYWAAAVAGGNNPELAASFLDFLADPVARRIAERRGFIATAV